MKSRPIHRSDTQKEADDQHYLTKLLRTQTRVDRLKDRAPSPIVIPTPPSPNPKADPFLAPHFSSTAPSTVAQPYQPAQPSLPAPAPAYKGHQSQQSSNVSPVRSPTPTPPVPKRPDESLASGLGMTTPLWCSSSTTLLEIDVLEDLDDDGIHNVNNLPNEKQELDLDYDLVVAPVRHSSYNYRTGTGADLSEYDPQRVDTMGVGASIMALRRTARDVASAAAVVASIAQGTSPTSPRLPQPLQDPEQVLDEQRVRHSRQEQMLKRSSQLFPVHHHHQQHELHQQGSQQQEAWKPQWRRTKNKYSLVRVSNGSSIGSDLEKEGLKSNEMTREEQEKLEELLQKKRRVENQHSGMRPSMDVLSEVSLHDDHRDHERRSLNRVGWLDRPSYCIPQGYMLAVMCILTLAFNGPIGILVFEASRFSKNDTNIPLLLFSVHFIFGGAFFFSGFIYLAIFGGGYSSRRPKPPPVSRASYLIFKFFHALYFVHVLLTFGCMMAWLGMNKLNTGSWDRMYIKAIQDASVHVGGFSFDTLLPQDPNNPEWWIINPYIWIMAFVVIFVFQLYFWVCLVAYGRRIGMRRQLARGLKF
ncbi:hypothetical protein EC968_002880 [Mortierella alpina]|nr:hypothetical protein EC968_002880 [Mortierella alpina]